MISKLRIASELHAAPGWVPLVPDSDTKAAYRTDVIMWIAPHPNSFGTAKEVVEAINQTGRFSPYWRCIHCEASSLGRDSFKHEAGCPADGLSPIHEGRQDV